MAVAFPNIKPSSRSYSAGAYPQTEFQAQNGAMSVVRFGSRRVDSELTLGFQNITDDQAVLILQNYERVNSVWDNVTFTGSNAAVGASSGLQSYLREVGGSGLRWRYAEAPNVTSIQPGISTVRCKFIGVLDGA
jgi:hypothetical protein